MCNAAAEMVAAGMQAAEIAQELVNGSAGAVLAPWPQPNWTILQERAGAAPLLPLDTFGPVWGPWIEAAAEGAGCPADYVALPLLCLGGTLLANVRRGSPWPGWEEASVIWGASVGDPSAGKSSGGAVVEKLGKLLEREMNGDLAERRGRYEAEKLAAEQREKAWKAAAKQAVDAGQPPPVKPLDARVPDEPARRRLVTSEPTVQMFVKLAADNPRGLFVNRDELAGWLGSMDQFSGAGNDRATWLESWKGGHFAQDRLKDGDEPRVVLHLAASVFGTIQPDRLASMLLRGDDDGLAARFLYVWPDAREPRMPDRAADLEAARWWLRRLLELPQDDGGEPRKVPFSPDARQAMFQLKRWVAHHERGATGRLKSWMGKMLGFALRLATVLRFLRWAAEEPGAGEPDRIEAADVEVAVRFLKDYAGPMAARAFGEAGVPEGDRDAVALARWLVANAAHLGGVVNARQLRKNWRVLGAGADAKRYDAALAELEQDWFVRPAFAREGGGAGRARKDWALNPALLPTQVA